MDTITIVPGSTITVNTPPAPPAFNLQERLNAGGVVDLPEGRITAGVLTITRDVILRGSGQQKTIIECEGIQVSTLIPNHYVVVGMSNLAIHCSGVGDVGLSLEDCRADLLNIEIADFKQVGLKISGGIGSRFDNVVSVRSPVCGLVDGKLSTTLVFSRCSFTQATDTAFKVVGNINSIAFTDMTVFETAKRGLVIDGCDMVTVSDCYWENVADEQLIIGENAPCSSVVVINPIMQASTNTATDAVRLDRVRSLTWLNGVMHGMSNKTALIRTTANTYSVFIIEPLAGTPGQGFIWGHPELVTCVGANGKLQTRQMQVGIWNIQSTWAWVQNDFVLVNGVHIPFYATPANTVRLAVKNDAGVLKGGIEVNNDGLIMRSPDGSRWQCSITDAGEITRVKL